MGNYSKSGTYAGYDKNGKQRNALDYYATPTEEALNILETARPDFNGKVVLDNSVGGGHLMQGILEYVDKYDMRPKALIGTDIQDRGFKSDRVEVLCGEDYDFLKDEYPIKADYIVMNPPFGLIEPFVLHSLEIAEKILMLGRTQFIESQSRYEKIFSQKKLSGIYQYVNRIFCYPNGDTSIKPAAIQSYAWFEFDNNFRGYPTLSWIRRKK